jgi:hypothetical protein
MGVWSMDIWSNRLLAERVYMSNGRLVEWTFGRMDSWLNGHLAEWTFGRTNIWPNGRICRTGVLAERTFGRTDVWPNGHLV